MTGATRDPDAAPRISLNLFDHLEDLQRMVTGIKVTRRIYGSAALAPYVGEELWPGPDAVGDGAIAEAILAAPTTYSHASCTCAMGQEGAGWAVVDQVGRVHGLDGLHVVDASIMPAIPSVPTNMTHHHARRAVRRRAARRRDRERGRVRGGAVMSPPGQLTGEFLRGWFALMDSAAPERVLELLADDFRFTVLFAKEDGAAEFGGGVEELRGYLAQREPDGQEHHIDLATSDGAREVVFGHTTRHGEPLATYTSVAELDADGRLRRLFSARTTALSFGDGP